MKVYKFGGASVKNASAVRNVASIIEKNFGEDNLLVVISAMGKTTNALEALLEAYNHDHQWQHQLEQIEHYHREIIASLFAPEQMPEVWVAIDQELKTIAKLLAKPSKEQPLHHLALYDQIVSLGEVMSSKILYHFLKGKNGALIWLDARKIIATDSSYREGKINWEKTKEQLHNEIKPYQRAIFITQGFVGGDDKGLTTTLGREGSDFTAAILASSIKAESVTIWKDVPGVLNADPKRIDAAVKFDELSYSEAAEMTYYGASVIHPKTIKPLAQLNIPLWVKSFDHPEERGTVIHDCEMKTFTPTIIFKPKQCLISFKVKDFTFVNENNLSTIFHILDSLNIKINVMQNSAISFSICVDQVDYKISQLLAYLKNDFGVLYNENLELITVKNYDQKHIDKVTDGREILLEQKSRHNFQIVVR